MVDHLAIFSHATLLTWKCEIELIKLNENCNTFFSMFRDFVPSAVNHALKTFRWYNKHDCLRKRHKALIKVWDTEIGCSFMLAPELEIHGYFMLAFYIELMVFLLCHIYHRMPTWRQNLFSGYMYLFCQFLSKFSLSFTQQLHHLSSSVQYVKSITYPPQPK